MFAAIQLAFFRFCVNYNIQWFPWKEYKSFEASFEKAVFSDDELSIYKLLFLNGRTSWNIVAPSVYAYTRFVGGVKNGDLSEVYLMRKQLHSTGMDVKSMLLSQTIGACKANNLGVVRYLIEKCGVNLCKDGYIFNAEDAIRGVTKNLELAKYLINKFEQLEPQIGISKVQELTNKMALDYRKYHSAFNTEQELECIKYYVAISKLPLAQYVSMLIVPFPRQPHQIINAIYTKMQECVNEGQVIDEATLKELSSIVMGSDNGVFERASAYRFLRKYSAGYELSAETWAEPSFQMLMRFMDEQDRLFNISSIIDVCKSWRKDKAAVFLSTIVPTECNIPLELSSIITSFVSTRDDDLHVYKNQDWKYPVKQRDIDYLNALESRINCKTEASR